MKIDQHLTIHDYFQRAGLRTMTISGNPSPSPVAPDAFARTLSLAGAGSGPDHAQLDRGRSIRDYFKAPVSTLPCQGKKTPPAALKTGLPGDGVAALYAGNRDPAPVSAAGACGKIKSTGDGTGSGVEKTIEASIVKASAKYNVPAALIHAVIKAESGFQPRVVSPAGAKGLMQLMPATAGELGVTDPFDIEQNIDGGTQYLSRMIARFNGDLKTALAAYNAGPAAVERYGGKVPYHETRLYIRRVMQYSSEYKGSERIST